MARVYRQPPSYLQTNNMVSLNAELRSDANHWPYAQGEPGSAPTRRANLHLCQSRCSPWRHSDAHDGAYISPPGALPPFSNSKLSLPNAL